MKVAVIGAGPAGLVAARECMREGCEVVVFEAGHAVGGVWVYGDKVDDDPLSQAASATVHSSLYQSLRTNIPRDLMAYSDYTFDSRGGGNDRWQRFPHHTCVQQYLENFARKFDIVDRVRFSCRVTHVQQNAGNWRVITTETDDVFDGVVVCNGHYARPRVPPIAGLKNFKGQLLHSHNYRRPRDVEGRRVAVWGSAASGLDLAYELDAQEIHWIGPAFHEKVRLDDRRIGYPSLDAIDGEGLLRLGNDLIAVDSLLFCTGYHYDFPFFDDMFVSVDEDWVNPLYEDIVPPHATNLGFIGLPFLIIPFPVFEMQAKWYARQLTGSFDLPSFEVMHASIDERKELLSSQGVLKRHYHRLGDHQISYYNRLAKQCGESSIPDWFVQTWREVGKLREEHSRNYKDVSFSVRGPTVCLPA
jgi:hypothetical protein